ncbi:MAG: hypothetical protein M0R46_16415 [Candidatus Muirbacterium halophilum]|nr:hypothetical protein [Candidatus Muirbacterium halophilum]
MKLDINEVNHNYIKRVVIFSLFLYKNYIRKPNVYLYNINNFIKNKLGMDINIKIDYESKSLEEEREILIDSLLKEETSNYQSIIHVSFNTSTRYVTMDIDINDEEKYSNFLYL